MKNAKNKSINSAVKEFLREHDIASVTVGLSGGCDSVTLLLSSVNALGAENVSAVHVNHGIRAGEAERDEEFCVRLCEKLGVRLRVFTADIPAAAKLSGKGLEECARDYRYEVFEQSISDFGSQALATAHNANDNAESVIFNLCRGTGLGGASGIPERLQRGSMTVIRPLLTFTRSELEAYLDGLSQPYVTDSTNADVAYTRNYIRANIIPHLSHINANSVNNITSCCRIVSDAEDFISKTAEDFISSQSKLADTYYIDIGKFDSLHIAPKTAVLGKLCTSVGGDTLGSVHVREILSFIPDAEPGTTIDLPGGVTLCRGSDSFSVYPERCKDDYSVNLVEGVNDLSPWGFNITLVFDPDENFLGHYKNIYKFVKWSILNADMIKGALSAKRHDGSGYVVDGMNRKIKKLLADKKIPHDKRRLYPLIHDEEQIICVPGCPPADGYDGRDAAHKLYIIYTYSE